MDTLFSLRFLSWSGHSALGLFSLFFGIVVGAFLMRNVATLREVRLTAIPILLCVGCILLLTHSGHGAFAGLVFDKGYALQYILYGAFFGMISYMLFRLFRIVVDECDLTTPGVCFAFLLFPIYLPIVFVFGRDFSEKKDEKKGTNFSVLRSCLCIVVLFVAAFAMAPHYSPKVFAEIADNNYDVRGLVMAHREDRKQ